MSKEDIYIGETSIQIGQHGFINQPKEIIKYIKYLQNQLQQKENTIKEVREYIEKHWACDEKQQIYLYELEDRKELLEILDKENK